MSPCSGVYLKRCILDLYDKGLDLAISMTTLGVNFTFPYYLCTTSVVASDGRTGDKVNPVRSVMTKVGLGLMQAWLVLWVKYPPGFSRFRIMPAPIAIRVTC